LSSCRCQSHIRWVQDPAIPEIIRLHKMSEAAPRRPRTSDLQFLSRMLKKSASSVLVSFRPSTYPRGYASALHSLRPCWTAFLSILQGCFPLVPHVRTSEVFACRNSFSAACQKVMKCCQVSLRRANLAWHVEEGEYAHLYSQPAACSPSG
jgi:hypothetical protein